MSEKQKKRLIRIIKWIILLGTLMVFAKITEDIFANEIFLFDEVIYQNISYFMNDIATVFFKIVTNLGSAITIGAVCVGSILFLKNKNYSKYIILNTILITVFNQVLKNIIQRPRPTEHRIINEIGYSFPSGHSMVSMAFYGFIIYLVYKNVENKKIKYIVCTILTVLILFIGISRIYLGVHYASDVIGGFCFSIAYLIAYTNLIRNRVTQRKE